MPNYELIIAQLAESNPTVEVCGVLKRAINDFDVVPLDNIAPKPGNTFQMRPSDYAPYYRDGSIAGYFHSHPHTDEKPSQTDIRMSESLQLPCVIYSLQTKRFFTYTPNGAKTPLLERQFSFGVLDCFSLVEDYYSQVLNISLAPVPREYKDMIEGIRDMTSLMRERNLVQVDSPKLHDIICMSVGVSSGACNHLGVHVGGSRMLHQLLNRKSEYVPYGGYWAKNTLFYARHKSLL